MNLGRLSPLGTGEGGGGGRTDTLSNIKKYGVRVT